MFFLKGDMVELLVTNDPVLLSYVESLLSDARIEAMVLDRNMSVLEGSIGILPRRVLVDTADLSEARQLLIDAGLEKWLPSTS